MSFSTNGQITVADSSAAEVIYSEVQNTGSQCIYADRTREIGIPRQLIISHQLVGTGEAARVRSMVKFSNSVENSALEGDVAEHRIHLVLDTPGRLVQKTDVEDVLAQFIDFISGGTFIDQITNREV